jgi:hypothetical protein
MKVAGEWVTLAAVALPAMSLAQDGHLNLPDFTGLAARASDHTDVSLDGGLVNFAGQFVDDKNPDAAQVHKLMVGIKNIEIHTYKFTTDDAYSKSDVDKIRRQLQAPNWKRLVQTHNNQEREDVDIYMSMDGQATNGLAIIATEPRQLTVINLVGTIDLKGLAKLGGQMGIPNQVAAAADSGTKPAAD